MPSPSSGSLVALLWMRLMGRGVSISPTTPILRCSDGGSSAAAPAISTSHFCVSVFSRAVRGSARKHSPSDHVGPEDSDAQVAAANLLVRRSVAVYRFVENW